MDWESALSGDPLELYGLPALLNQRGIEELEIEGAPQLTWSYAGIYEVRVNGGGLISTIPKPPRSFLFSVKRLNIREVVRSGAPAVLGGDVVEGFINPLGWRPRMAVLVDEAPPGRCIAVDERIVSLPDLEPLHVGEPMRCGAVALSSDEMKMSMGPFSLSLAGRVGRAHGIAAIASERFIAAATSSGLSVVSEDLVRLMIKHPYRDFRVAHLSVLSFFDRWSSSEELSSNVVVVSGPSGSIALSSPSGISVRVGAGSMEVEGREIFVSLGGEQEGFKNLMEAITLWRPATVGSRPLGHARIFSSIAFLALLSADRAVFYAQNPFNSDGLVEIRIHHRLRGAAVSYGKERTDVVPARGVITAPLPRGACATIEAWPWRGLRT